MKTKKLNTNFKEDMEFAGRTEDAWKSHENGKFISMPSNKFLDKIISKKRKVC